jgi:uncharacterized protein (TIGR03435 family)
MIRVFVMFTLFLGSTRAQQFEVVSVKPNKSISNSSGFTTDGGRLTATNVSLRGLIWRAFGLQDYQVEGPDWLNSERFDVSATFPEGLPKDRDRHDAAFQAMLQNMLADRFKLAAHREQKTRPVYGLVIGKSGIKFKEAPDCDTHSRNSNGNQFTGTCVSMAAFAEFLARRKRDLPVDLPVLDMTGLKGFYTLTLDWNKDTPIADALQEQLGLKLETRQAPIEILIVDHSEKVPSEN